MAWTTLSFAYGSILTSTKMTQLYDNITAQANGDSGSPQQQTAGIADDAVTAAKIDGPAAATTYDIFFDARSVAQGYTVSVVKIFEYLVPFAGTVRIDWLMEATGSSVSSRAYINGVAQGTTKTTSTSTTCTETSLTVAAGDLLQVYIVSVSLGETGTLSNVRIGSSVLPVHITEQYV